MIFKAIECPFCKDTNIIKAGVSIKTGKQRYKCKNLKCSKTTFIMDYSYNGSQPKVKAQIVEMALNGSGIRDTARVLKISPSTVISEFKKKESAIEKVNIGFIQGLETDNTEVRIERIEESEMDEMWSFVGNKSNQRWLGCD